MNATNLRALSAAAAAALAFAACTQSHPAASETFAEQTTPVGVASAPALAPSSRPDTSATAKPQVQSADAARGKQLYAENCAACHGAGGEGGVGPSLHNERARKNQTQAVAWIKNPQPPMPKLYPAPLSERDVDDVAAFVLTL